MRFAETLARHWAPAPLHAPHCYANLRERNRAAQAYKTYKLGGKLSEMLYSPATYGVDFGGGGGGRDRLPRPKARANAHLAVVGNTLWLLGGLVEVRDCRGAD